MLNFLDIMRGSKTYLLLLGMIIMATLEQYTSIQIPAYVYEMMGLGSAVTAKMAIDRMMNK